MTPVRWQVPPSKNHVLLWGVDSDAKQKEYTGLVSNYQTMKVKYYNFLNLRRVLSSMQKLGHFSVIHEFRDVKNVVVIRSGEASLYNFRY